LSSFSRNISSRDGKAIERDLIETEPAAFLDDRPDALDAPAVAEDPGPPPVFRPAAVAVHDDGDVPGQLLGPEPGSCQPRQTFIGDLIILHRIGL
jgi:hypothetical protein